MKWLTAGADAVRVAGLLAATARLAAAAALPLALAAAPSFGQTLEPKRTLPGAAREGCPPPASLPSAAPEAQSQARVMLARAQEALLAADHAIALDLLDQAARVDPTNPDVAYHRARLLEDGGQLAHAAAEYCRFLQVARDAGDAQEARDRLVALMLPSDATVGPPLAEHFLHGLVYYDRGNLRQSERAFNFVLHHQPELAEAYFNRALVHLARGRSEAAARDFEAYLAAAPGATDSLAVAQQLEALRSPSRGTDPSTVLLGGVLIPGLGQFATRRPLLGTAVLAGVGGAIALGLQTRQVERTEGFEDPFGNPREFTYMDQEQPYLAAGVAAAVAITLIAAAEAYTHARGTAGRGLAGAQRPGNRGGVVAGLTARPGAVGLRLEIPTGFAGSRGAGGRD